jgi:hypothetical protein
MKTLKNILTLALILTATATFSSPALNDTLRVVDTEYSNLFVLKADKALKGAEVKVYHANGDLVTTQTLSKRKIVIDFCDVKFGSYVIKVIKDGNTREFHYVKELILSEIIR